MKLALSFDDVSLIPWHSELSSRSDADIGAGFPFGHLDVPIISSPMDTVTDIAMQKAMKEAGGLGIHHRYCSKEVLLWSLGYGGVAVSPSLGEDFIRAATSVIARPLVMIDVAHGDSKNALDYAEFCVRQGCIVVSGNICTRHAAYRYAGVGVKIFRVGVGAGAACSTRRVAGVGIPQLSAIMDVSSVRTDEYIISDGGITCSGDIVKALAAGADAVMCGRLLAGSDEAPGERRQILSGQTLKSYRGMASKDSLEAAGKEVLVEGVSSWVPTTGPVADTLRELANGIRAGFAYLGARNITELRENAEFVQVTQNGHIEGTPRV